MMVDSRSPLNGALAGFNPQMETVGAPGIPSGGGLTRSPLERHQYLCTSTLWATVDGGRHPSITTTVLRSQI